MLPPLSSGGGILVSGDLHVSSELVSDSHETAGSVVEPRDTPPDGRQQLVGDGVP